MNRVVIRSLSCVLLFVLSSQASAQLDISKAFSKKNSKSAVVDFKGKTPSWALFDFESRDGVLTFDGPNSAIKKLQTNTQKALTGTKEAISRPFQELKNVQLWPRREANEGFLTVPNWMRGNPGNEVSQPTTLADWLAQPRPE